MRPKRTAASEAAGGQVRVEISTGVLRRIRQHARSSMSAEICGVLVGSFRQQTTVVEDSIEGEQARQGGSHVTFTQDTWTHIYQIKDTKFPDKRIVGWYHSHPGFGIFLSDHDTFIHKNFFSNESQVAWVYDPHSDEEGCFVWEKSEIVRALQFSLRDDPASDAPAGPRKNHERRSTEPLEGLAEEEPWQAPARRKPWVRWLGLSVSHLLLLLLGFLIGSLLAPPIVVVPERAPGIDQSSPNPKK